MKILFDQGTPRPLRHYLAEHSVQTASEKGWSRLGNGDLIEKAEQGGYEVLLTTDQNIRYQQNLVGKQLSIVVLRSTAWPDIQRKVGEIRAAVNTIRPGELKDVSI